MAFTITQANDVAAVLRFTLSLPRPTGGYVTAAEARDAAVRLTEAARQTRPAGLLPDQVAEAFAEIVGPVCRVCNCTEDEPCPGGCWWVPDPKGGDLCNVCYAKGLGR